ncbi:MAG: hypothetical protein J7M39_07535 [Anaerolineae bacterium]|nr:hypothetical protein [Anaerolineae bacterium]
MATKTYTLPYDTESKSWDALAVSAQVMNQANQKTQKLDPKVQVEDASSSAYPALTNSVLLLESTEIISEIEIGEVAKIHLRLNDRDTRINQILAHDTRFKLKVTLWPDLNQDAGSPPKPGSPVEGITEIVVEVPQVWDFTLRKTLWDDSGPIDLNKIEGVDRDALQELGNWGGTLVLQPKGQLVDEAANEKITSTKTIAHASECILDRGMGQLVKGEWEDSRKGYVFEIKPSQNGDPPAGAGGELALSPAIPPHQGWQRQLSKLLAAARKIGSGLAPDVPRYAKTYVQGCLDHIAAKPDEVLAERRSELNIWLLNTTHFIGFMDNATEMFNKALALFDEAHKRFLDNMVNFAVELVFALFDVMDLVFKSAAQNAKVALKGSTKEMVEELSEKAARELIQQREVIEQGVKVSRESLNSLDTQIADVWTRFPKDISDPTPQLLRQMDTVSQEARLLTQQRQQLYRQFTGQKKELVDLQANILISREIKDNAAQATEKEFLDKIKEKAMALPNSPEIHTIIGELEELGSRDVSEYMARQTRVQQMMAALPSGTSPQTRASLERLSTSLTQHIQAIQTETLIDLNKNTYGDMLAKGPLGNKLKEVNERAQSAKKAAESIRYQNVAWEHYKGLFSPLWWFMDWSLAQILWLHDLAREWIPGLAMAESLLATAVETVLSYVMSILNAMIDFMNSHQWRRSCINSEVRGLGQATAMANGTSAAFFNFPQSTKKLPGMLKPRSIVAMGQNGSPAQMRAVKQRLLTNAGGGYQQERSAQRSQARTTFANLCRGALDAQRLEQPAPEQLVANTLSGVWRQLAGPMVEYEKAFKATGAQGTDYLWSAGRFAQNSTFQDWDGAIEWLAWSVAWGLRLGGVLAVFTGVGAAALPAAFAAAQGAEWIGAVLRPAVSWLGTMPDIIAFQYDVVIVAAAAYEASTKGEVSLDNLVVPSEYTE